MYIWVTGKKHSLRKIIWVMIIKRIIIRSLRNSSMYLKINKLLLLTPSVQMIPRIESLWFLYLWSQFLIGCTSTQLSPWSWSPISSRYKAPTWDSMFKITCWLKTTPNGVSFQLRIKASLRWILVLREIT